eukprot:gene32141-41673_t
MRRLLFNTFDKPGIRCMDMLKRYVSRTSSNILKVSLVGRPNTGKSTLFNRLTRSKLAIVSAVPGTTRDRKLGHGYLAGMPIEVIDTGGLDDRGAVSSQVQTQVELAMNESDVVLFMLDSRVGVTALDLHFARWIRKTVHEKGDPSNNNKREVVILANKAEGAHMSEQIMDTFAEASRLGFGEPLLISASHGDGLADLAQNLFQSATRLGKLLDDVKPKPKEDSPENDEVRVGKGKVSSAIPVVDRTIQVAIMGRPNVGKSSLLNAFVGTERVITGPTAGLTRDSVQVQWEHKDRLFQLVDTAGLRRLRANPDLCKQGVLEDKFATKVNNLGTDVASESASLARREAKEGKLPGRADYDPEQDPSQYSRQVAELALQSALNSLRFAQVVLLVVESPTGVLTPLELQLIHRCLLEGRGLVIAVNKLDLLIDPSRFPGKKQKKIINSDSEYQSEDAAGEVMGEVITDKSTVFEVKDFEAAVRGHCNDIVKEFGSVPIVICSVKENYNVKRLLDVAIAVHDAWSKRMSTWILNGWLRDALITAAPARVGNKTLKVKYMTQVKSRPPTFTLFCNMAELPGFFERFLKSRLQRDFKLEGVPIRFTVKKTEGKETDTNLLKQVFQDEENNKQDKEEDGEFLSGLAQTKRQKVS